MADAPDGHADDGRPHPVATLLVRRRGEHRAMPWRNGGGTTREVAIGPAGAAANPFDWRVSIAEVTSSGPFSAYPGVDRIIMLVTGPVMALTVDGIERELRPFVPFEFAGEAGVSCRVPEPTRDLNVMTRRGRSSATLEVLAGGPARAVGGGDPLIVVAVAGDVQVTGPGGTRADLGALDAALWADPRPLTIAGPGTAAAIRIRSAT